MALLSTCTRHMQFFFLCLLLAHSSAGPIVVTPLGSVEGIDSGEFYVFKGVPFAESTAGANRWRLPVPIQPWHDVLDATQFKSACMQKTPIGK